MQIRTIFLIILIIFVSGCATLPHPTTTQSITRSERQAQLRALNNWEVSGALGVIYANKSDIAHFDWQQQENNYTINIHGPLHIGSADIIGTEDSVILRQSNAKELQAKNPETLIKREFGWTLPISNLRSWVLAVPAQTKITKIQFDTANHLVYLEQQGWQIEYTNFTAINGIDLPTKIKLQKQNLTVKLAIKSWTLNTTKL